MNYDIKQFETGPFLVNTWVMPLNSKSAVVIDPGGAEAALIDYLAELGISRLEIMLTHGHFDHVGGIPALMRSYPGSRLWIHEADAGYLGACAKEVHLKTLTPLRAQRLLDSFPPALPDATDFFADGSEVNGFTVLHTPGHTKGSVCLWHKAAGVVFSGDTLFYGSRGRTDLPGGDETQIRISLQQLFDKLPGETAVYPGHGSRTSVGFEKKFQG